MNKKIVSACLCALAIFVPLSTSSAASFDCRKAFTRVERLICGNEDLSKLDETLNKAYMRALENTGREKDTIRSQRQWLKNERNLCKSERCLKNAYEARITELGFSHYGITIFRLSDSKATKPKGEPITSETPSVNIPVEVAPERQEPIHDSALVISRYEKDGKEDLDNEDSEDDQDTNNIKQQKTVISSDKCEFSGLSFAPDYAIFAGGNYSGKVMDYQIDQSGHQATLMDVSVNFTDKPVVLILGAYEPTIWNIRWTEDTKIIAVIVGGYHRQALAGIDTTVPTLNTSYDNGNPCGYFYVSERELEKLNPLSRRFFGRPVDLVYIAKRGKILIGKEVLDSQWITSKVITPESFYDKTAPLAGTAGLQDAVRKGLLRKATDADVAAWVKAVIANSPKRDVPPIAGQGQPEPPRPGLYNAYVVLKQFTYPAGLYGGNLATFFIPKGVPQPKGNPGHSSVHDFNKLKCRLGK